MRKLLRKGDVADLLGVHISTLDNWRRDDPSFPSPVDLPGRSIRWRPDDIDAWIEGRKVPAGATVLQRSRR